MSILSCSTIIFRGAVRRRDINPLAGRFDAGAFMLRDRARDPDGLSVFLAAAACSQYVKCYGVASLHTGRVRDIELPVRLDIVGDDELHALITGLPYPQENPADAEYAAGMLAKQARLVDEAEWKHP